MPRSFRHVFPLALVVLVLPLLACNPSWLTVEIPDFNSKRVEGVWIWRLSQSNQYMRDTLIVFQGVTTLTSGQVLNYAIYSNAGNMALTTAIDHNATNSDVVTLKLGFLAGPPGVFKVSTYNGAGESPLSSQSESL